jgi:NhaP-type Na+/H+ or K+/H+ antiporter
MVPLILLGILAFSLIIFAYSLFARPLDESIITAPMVFVAAGLVLGSFGLDVLDFDSHSSLFLIFAEIALVLVLFADAARIDPRALKGNTNLPLRLLVIGLPLTILAGSVGAILLFTSIALPEAALIGTILAPTDAGLGQAIVNSPKVPARIRQALNVESGLNDGGAIPFFFLFLAFAEASAEGIPASQWVIFAIEQIGVGILMGAAVGYIGSTLIQKGVEKGWMRGEFARIGFLALALISFVAASAAGGSGFIAAFVGGLAAAAAGKGVGESVIEFTETGGQILSLGVFFVFGLLAADLLSGITGTILLYAILSLTLVRMVPVAVSLIRAHLSPASIAFLGWFGPRGLASIVLLFIVYDEASAIPGIQTVTLVVGATVLLSVFAHGITANPAINRYAKLVENLPQDAPERMVVHEVPARTWYPGSGKS